MGFLRGSHPKFWGKSDLVHPVSGHRGQDRVGLSGHFLPILTEIKPFEFSLRYAGKSTKSTKIVLGTVLFRAFLIITWNFFRIFCGFTFWISRSRGSFVNLKAVMESWVDLENCIFFLLRKKFSLWRNACNKIRISFVVQTKFRTKSKSEFP